MRRAARVDANQAEIVAALRDVGCSVADTSRLGQGFPDLVVGRAGITFLLEIKNGRAIPSAQRLTPDEQAWHQAWRGQVAVVRSVEEALAVVGIE